MLFPSIVCSVAPTVTCDSRPLRIIFKLPLWEAEDTFKTDISYSLISAYLCCLLAPLSLFSLFHPIHLKQFAAIQFTSYLLSRLVSSSLGIIVLRIILHCIYYTISYFIIVIGYYQFVHLSLYNYILPSPTYQLVQESHDILPIRIYDFIQQRVLPSHIYKFIRNTNITQFCDILLVFTHELPIHIK